MDNGSKAVIIAGTILIVIFVATFLIMFFDRSSETASTLHEENMGSDVYAFNTQFSIYNGKNRTKSEIDKLVTKINASNSNSDYKITLSSSGGYISGDVVNGYKFSGSNTDSDRVKLYEVVFTFDNDGRIKNVQIK